VALSYGGLRTKSILLAKINFKLGWAAYGKINPRNCITQRNNIKKTFILSILFNIKENELIRTHEITIVIEKKTHAV